MIQLQSQLGPLGKGNLQATSEFSVTLSYLSEVEQEEREKSCA